MLCKKFYKCISHLWTYVFKVIFKSDILEMLLSLGNIHEKNDLKFSGAKG